jgi:predicted DNA-binding transcriptional regulator AlpA
MAEPIYLLTGKAAEHLGLAKSTLDKMRVRGDGPPFLRLSPRRIVYAVDALDQWARSREHQSTSEYVPAA